MPPNSESEPAASVARAPAAFLGMVPGGRLGARERHGVAELKAAISCLVVPLFPGAILVSEGATESVAAFDHLTVHRDLMVHLRGPSGVRLLLPPSIRDGNLAASAILLASFSTPPTEVTRPRRGRFQAKYEGGVPVLPFAPDLKFDPRATHLVVDLWASEPWFTAPAFLPPADESFRPAISYSGTAALGPLPATWAFRCEPSPPCVFHLRFWYAEYPSFAVQTLRPGGTALTIEPPV